MKGSNRILLCTILIVGVSMLFGLRNLLLFYETLRAKTTTTAGKWMNSNMGDYYDDDGDGFHHRYNYSYSPSGMEAFVREHRRSKRLGYDKTIDVGYDELPSGCDLYWNETVVSDAVFRDRTDHLRSSLETYERLQSEWVWDLDPHPIKSQESRSTTNDNDNNTTTTAVTANQKRDLRNYLDADGTNRDAVCDALELHEDGMVGIFPEDLLSKVQLKSASGSSRHNDGAFVKQQGQIFLEPLLPPLRHPEFCFEYHRVESETGPENRTDRWTDDRLWNNHRLLDWGFLVHDFAGMCRYNLRNKRSRTIFMDIGASLSFHGTHDEPPALRLLRLYEKFGFVFDHVYAFEIGHQDPSKVYRAIPDDLKAAYHWYNVGVDASPINSSTSYRNPFRLLLDSFNPDDFVVVKLDIDTPHIENPLAEQLLEDPRLAELVDVFYYEQHVALKELAIPWGGYMAGSMQSSIEFFAALRSKGIAAHYWI